MSPCWQAPGQTKTNETGKAGRISSSTSARGIVWYVRFVMVVVVDHERITQALEAKDLALVRSCTVCWDGTYIPNRCTRNVYQFGPQEA